VTARTSTWGIVLLLSAWALAFSLAAHLTSLHREPGSSSGIADLLLGGSRQALSQNLFNEADMYFHKGVAHKETTMDIPGPFRRWQAEIIPAHHAHAEGDASAEILPWLKLATEADPHNVDAFLVSSFWAGTGLHRPDLAKEILNEAQRLNPGDYRIALEKGRLSIMTHHFNEAIPLLDSALTLHTHTPAAPEHAADLALDRAEIHTFLGFLHEAKGDRTEAIQNFKAVLTIFPERTMLKERIDLLEAGKPSSDSAESLLERITRKSVHDTCDDVDHDHEPHS
jgi:tetratricopeptide (TPR) repeat protein